MSVQLFVSQPAEHLYHGYLDDIRRRTLHGGVHCRTLAEGLNVLVFRRKLGDISAPAEYGLGIALAFRIGNGFVHKFLYLGEV